MFIELLRQDTQKIESINIAHIRTFGPDSDGLNTHVGYYDGTASVYGVPYNKFKAQVAIRTANASDDELKLHKLAEAQYEARRFVSRAIKKGLEFSPEYNTLQIEALLEKLGGQLS